MIQTGTLPNFLIIGAAKSGTDSLYDMLGQHPDVYVSPNKEPMFFVAEGVAEIPFRGPGDRETLVQWDGWVSTRERYEALFAGATTEKAVGEASTWYLYDEGAPHRIRRLVPEVRMIALLRNPVERAYSAFTMLLRDGRETTDDFVRALAAEDERVRAGWEPLWHYRRMGFYHRQLSRYLGLFRREQICVLLQEDLNTRPQETLRKAFAFLGVDEAFQPRSLTRMNVSLVPVNGGYHRLVRGQNPIKSAGKALLPKGVRARIKARLPEPAMKKPDPMPAEARAALVDVFREDVLALQKLLGRDLTHWLR